MNEQGSGFIDVEAAIVAHATFRDHIATTVHGEHQVEAGAFTRVAISLFNYSFNTYKAIGLLLPERYFEQGMSLHRTMWETVANFVWIGTDPDPRSHQFLGFTAVEHRRFLQARVELFRRSGNAEGVATAEKEIVAYDQVLSTQLDRYRHTDRQGRKRLRDRYSGPSLENVVRDLGEPWTSEYLTNYQLGSFFTHGAPGGVLFSAPPAPESLKGAFSGVDNERTALLVVFSMDVMNRSFARFKKLLGVDENDFYEKLRKDLLGANAA